MAKGRSYNQRLKLFYILEYLKERTDETHTVKNKEIENYLKDKNIPIEKKTVVSDLHLLEDYGYPIEYDGRTKGYRLIERDFELQELQLLIDSVQSSRFITQKMAKKLTDKLKEQASVYDRAVLDRHCYVTNRIRSMNDSIFYYVDDIHFAIGNNKKIKFKYFTINEKKKKYYYKKGEYYSVSPYALLWNEGNYYLLAYESNKMKHFRVDRMDSIEIVDEKREGKEEYKNLTLSERSLKVFSMYGGKEYNVKLRVSNHLAGVIFERFGNNVMVIPDDDKHFTVNVNVEVSPQFYGWLCGLGKGVRVVYPQEVIDGMKKHIQGICDMY